MYNVCRRGPTSICRILRTTPSLHRPIARSSTFALSAPKVSTSTISPRFLHIISATQQRHGVGFARSTQYEDRYERQDERPEDNAEKATIVDDGPQHTKFQELADGGLVHKSVIREITERMGHHTMTPVQTLTVNQALKGVDTIAQARTGTGKTLGFLVPVVQNILNNNPELAEAPRYSNRPRVRASDIRGIVIAPTRELAEQIAVEARKITRSTSIQVQVAVGGNSKTAMLRQMQREGCHLLIATPGRLNDLLTDPYSKVSAPDLSTLVLDEADRLLDGGFSDAIEDIIRLLPDRTIRDRQTLLFSATVPREVMHLVRRTLKPDFQFVQTVQPGEAATHEKVPQKMVEVPGMENLMPTLLELCKRELDRVEKSTGAFMPFKAIVYFSSTANVELAARIFENLSTSGELFGKHPLWPAEISQMHAKLTQQQRTRVSDRFRRAKSAILFSTDVTARGMDFPNVSHVIQVGLPPNRDQYIHRVGRTGRGEKSGEGWILVSRAESRQSRSLLRGLPIVPDTSLQAPAVDMTREAQLPTELAATLSQIANATKMVDKQTKSAAYLAALGTMQSIENKQVVVDTLNQWTRFGWGWEAPPPISPALADRLGLRRVRGLVTGRPQVDPEDGSTGGYGRDRGGFGGGRDRDSGGYGGSRGGSSHGRARGGSSYGRDRGGSGYGRDRGFGDRGARQGYSEDGFSGRDQGPRY